MKKKLIIIITFLLLSICTFGGNATFAASNNITTKTITSGKKADSKKEKSTVKSKFQNGTLTIYGKGKMPKKMTFKKNMKIKKVIIKKGVTSICPNAFYKCKNLKKVTFSNTVKNIYHDSFYKTGIKGTLTIPKTVKYVGEAAFAGCNHITKLKIPGNISYGYKKNNYREWCRLSFPVVKHITFTTRLKIRWVKYFRTQGYTVKKSDPKYKSVGGVIYTKDGKSIVRVPSHKKSITPIKTCKTFNLASIMYGTQLSEEGEKVRCNQLKRIVIPKTVERVVFVEDDKTPETYFSAPANVRTIKIHSKKLDVQDLKTILTVFRWHFKEKNSGANAYDNYISLKSVLNQVPYIVTNHDGMYITKDGVLITNILDTQTRIIPEGVVEIWDDAFHFNIDDKNFNSIVKLETVKFPSTLKIIGEYAFADCAKLKKIDLPFNLKEIKPGAFMSCDSLTSVTLPTGITRISGYCFAFCDNLETVKIPNGVTCIGYQAFYECEKLANVEIPKTLKVVYDEAFKYTLVEKTINKKYPKDVIIKP